MKERLYYLDWLRTFAFGLLIIFHCLRFFDFLPWHIKNQEQSEFVMQFFIFTTSWRMPLIFLVSGAGTYFALNSQREHFLWGRVKRLLIPYLFGIVILIPPQKYYEYIFYNANPMQASHFFLNYPAYVFDADFGFSLIWLGHLGYHIWYLPYLFIQTIIFLPLMRWVLMRPLTFPIKNKIQLSLFLCLPLVFINIVLRPFFPEYLSWADFFHFGFFYLLGFLIVKFRIAFVQLIDQSWIIMLTLALASSGIIHYFALYTQYMIKWIDQPDYSMDYMVFVAIRSLNAITWVMVFFGLAHRYLKKNHPYLSDFNEAILPVYLLHQTIIVFVGFYIVQYTWGIGVKFLSIFLITSILIVILYKLIKSLNIFRYLFGMKLK